MGKLIAAATTTLVLFLNMAAVALACPYCPTPTPPPPPPPKPTTTPCPPPPPPPCPPPPSVPSPKAPSGACPIDTLKLGACVDLLGGLAHATIGEQVKAACCPVLEGVADLDAALCLCTTIRVKALNVNVVLPIALELLVNCGKHVPADYKCPAY